MKDMEIKQGGHRSDMLTIYIAGPISHRSAWGREANVRSALAVALEVAKHDMAFICVHAWGERFWEEIDEEHALRMDFALIERCDCVLLAPGWQRSNGTGREIAFCHEISKPVFLDIADLVHWRDHGGGGYSNALQMGALPPGGGG